MAKPAARLETASELLLRSAVREALEVSGKTQTALADYVGHQNAWASDFLAGKMGITVKDLDKIADFLELKVIDLFAGPDHVRHALRVRTSSPPSSGEVGDAAVETDLLTRERLDHQTFLEAVRRTAAELFVLTEGRGHSHESRAPAPRQAATRARRHRTR